MELSSGDPVYVDDDVAQALAGERWKEESPGAVRRHFRENGRMRSETLGARVMGRPAARGHVWTHRDGNPRNFRRENLAEVPRGHNLSRISPERRQAINAEASKKGGKVRGKTQSAAGFSGVYASGPKFKAMAMVAGKQAYLGVYPTREEAAYAYDCALKREGHPAVNKPDLSEEASARVEAAVMARLTPAQAAD